MKESQQDLIKQIDLNIAYLAKEKFSEEMMQESINTEHKNYTVGSEEHQCWANHEHRKKRIKSIMDQLVNLKNGCLSRSLWHD